MFKNFNEFIVAYTAYQEYLKGSDPQPAPGEPLPEPDPAPAPAPAPQPEPEPEPAPGIDLSNYVSKEDYDKLLDKVSALEKMFSPSLPDITPTGIEDIISKLEF